MQHLEHWSLCYRDLVTVQWKIDLSENSRLLYFHLTLNAVGHKRELQALLRGAGKILKLLIKKPLFKTSGYSQRGKISPTGFQIVRSSSGCNKMWIGHEMNNL